MNETLIFGASLVGTFVKYELCFFTESNEGEIKEEHRTCFFFACFQRFRLPALSLHIPCELTSKRVQDGSIQHQLCLVERENGLLSVHTDFSMAKDFLLHPGKDWLQFVATPLIHGNIRNTLQRVTIKGEDTDREQQLLGQHWMKPARSKDKSNAKSAATAAATPDEDPYRESFDVVSNIGQVFHGDVVSSETETWRTV
jgi:hypothetical protein